MWLIVGAQIARIAGRHDISSGAMAVGGVRITKRDTLQTFNKRDTFI